MSRFVLANQAIATKRRVYFDLRDATDGITPETGEAAGQPEISTNGGAFTDTGIGTLTHIGNGRYFADPTQAAVATAGDVIETRFKSANTAESPGDTLQIVAFDPDDIVRLGLTALPAAAAEAAGGLYTRGTGAGQINQPANGRIDTNVVAMAAAVITAAAIATDAIGAAKFAQGAADKVWDTAARILTANTNFNDPAVAAIADAVWDEPVAGHVGAGSFGKTDADILADTNELQGDDVPGLIAALNDPTVAAIADGVWDEPVAGHVGAGSFGKTDADILADTNELQTDNIPSLISGLNDPTAAVIADAVWDEAVAGHVSAGTFGKTDADILADTNELQGDDIPTLIAALNDLSAADVNAQADLALSDIHLDHLLAVDYDPASIPGVATALLNELIESNAGVSRYTAAALFQAPTGGSAPTVGQIADAVWDEAVGGHVGAGTFGKTDADTLADTNELQADDVPTLIAALNDPTAAVIADAVWDEATAGHVAAGSFGKTDADTLADTNELQGDDVPGLIAALNDPTVAAIADGVWDENVVAAHGAASAAGLLLRALGAVISARANNATLNALLGVADTAGTDVPEQVWAEGTRSLTDKAGFSLAADFRVKKNVALANFMFLMVDTSDHVTPLTGLTVSGFRSLDGAAFAATATATATEISNGWYKINLAAGDLNADTVALRFTAATADDTNILVVTQTE